MQGIKADTTPAAYTLTDPAICTEAKEHGATDMGAPAQQRFWVEHLCGGTCAALHYKQGGG